MSTELFFAEATNLTGLRDAIRARVEQLNLSRSCLDEIIGCASGLSGKLLCQGESKDPKRIVPRSLELMLQATGLKLLVVDDQEALAKVQPMFVEREAAKVRLGNQSRKNAQPKSRTTTKRSMLWNGRRD